MNSKNPQFMWLDVAVRFDVIGCAGLKSPQPPSANQSSG
jgi:hypothetical protein